MRLWQKIFLASVMLFIVLFSVGGYLLLLDSYRQTMDREIDRGLGDQLVMRQALQTSLTNVILRMGGTGNLTLDILQRTVSSFALYYSGSGSIYMEVWAQGKCAFSNFPAELPQDRPEVAGAAADYRQTILRDAGGRTYMFTSSLMRYQDFEYVFVSIRDITAVYEAENRLMRRFVGLSLAFSVAAGLVMLFLSLWITAPIKRLTAAARFIAAGNHSKRAPRGRGSDEVSDLTDSFNAMADATERHVAALNGLVQDQRRFSENLTHELKTPLTTIIGYADLLLSAPHDEQMQRKALTYIREEGKRMEALSQKLMALIRYQRTDIEKADIDVAAFIERMRESALPLAQQRGVRLESSSVQASLKGDADLLSTLCLNLLDNAIKASAGGAEVSIRAEAAADGLTIAVEDHGIGIPPEEVARVTEPFYTVNKARTRASHGAGLGLAICVAIARAHGAALTIRSKPGEGTAVCVKFPV